MDIRRQGMFGYLTLNGRPLLLNESRVMTGSVMSIVAETLKTLQASRSRNSPADTLQITLRIDSKPFTIGSDGVLELGKVEELTALVEGDADAPFEGESYEDFYHRLLASEYSTASAEFIAGQWFDKPVNPATTLWLNDPRAVRFRELNSRDEAFEAALPSEYESLKHYVQTTYPEFVDGLVLRTA